jgi:hypothetical protein
MANLSLTRVNQKLAQAKILLSDIVDESLIPIHRNSIMEAAAFHLVCAYQHYLRELAEVYGLKHAIAIHTELDLTNAFEVATKHPAEADELLALRSDTNSWLAQLQGYYDSLWQLPRQVISQADAESNDNLINMVNLDAVVDQQPVSLESIKRWHGEFIALVVRQRETSAEF